MTMTTTATTRATLHRLLDTSLLHGPEFGAGLSSHLPMVLHALAELGASPARLQAFHDHYARRFAGAAPRPPVGAELGADWRGARGDFAAFDSLQAHFAALLRDNGREAVLRLLLPALWPGAAGAAFHGLIRTAHAVQSGHDAELAAALAYWAARWQAVPVPAAPPAGAPLPFAAWAARGEAAALAMRLPGRLISSRIAEAVATPHYTAWADASAIDSLEPLSNWAADLYARSGNFTVLHIVTATRAARVLWPWTAARGEVLQGLLRAVLAALLASNLQLDDAARAKAAGGPPQWAALVEAAIASDDDHVVKLVHALLEERAAYGEGHRRLAAARALKPASG
jgi:Questin oxidase-like